MKMSHPDRFHPNMYHQDKGPLHMFHQDMCYSCKCPPHMCHPNMLHPYMCHSQFCHQDIWVIRTRTGKKLDKCHFFFKSQRLLRTEKSKNSYTFKSYYLILVSAVLKIWVSGFRRKLGCAPYARSWVFFQDFQNTAFTLIYWYYSASTCSQGVGSFKCGHLLRGEGGSNMVYNMLIPYLRGP